MLVLPAAEPTHRSISIPGGLTQQTSPVPGALAAALSRPVRLRAAILAAVLGVGGQGEGSRRCCPFSSGFACWKRRCEELPPPTAHRRNPPLPKLSTPKPKRSRQVLLFTCAAPGGALGQPVTLASPWPARDDRGGEDGGHGFGWPQGALEGFAGVPPRALLQDLDDGILLQDLGMKGF